MQNLTLPNLSENATKLNVKWLIISAIFSLNLLINMRLPIFKEFLLPPGREFVSLARCPLNRSKALRMVANFFIFVDCWDLGT